MQVHLVEPNFNPGDPLGLCDSLEGKMEAFKKFLNATFSLRTALESDDMARIEASINERESCMVHINKIDEYIRRISKEDPAYLGRLSPNRREKIKGVLGAIEEVLDQMKEMNMECLASAAQRIKMIQLEMSRITDDRRDLRDQYSQIPAARFVDITS